jgi:hypothetical protein
VGVHIKNCQVNKNFSVLTAMVMKSKYLGYNAVEPPIEAMFGKCPSMKQWLVDYTSMVMVILHPPLCFNGSVTD